MSSVTPRFLTVGLQGIDLLLDFNGSGKWPWRRLNKTPVFSEDFNCIF